MLSKLKYPTIFVLLVCTSHVESSPILLGGFDVKGDSTIPTPSSDAVQFVLDVGNEDEGRFALVTPFLRAGDSVILSFSNGTDQDFQGFSQLITNDLPDTMRFVWAWENDPCPFPCVGQGGFIQDVDFGNLSIESILFTVHELSIEPVNLLGDESKFSFDVSYDVYATAIPDPSAGILLLAGAIVQLKKRRGKSEA